MTGLYRKKSVTNRTTKRTAKYELILVFEASQRHHTERGGNIDSGGKTSQMSSYRNALWYRKGLKEYTRDGFVVSKKRFNVQDIEVDCTGKVFMITGANSGIGKSAAMEIARKAGILHLVCRNKEKGESVRREIVETTGNPNIHIHIVDMSNPHRILEFAREFKERHTTLTVLINNAGCIVNTREATPDGIQRIFCTNVLGPYILTTSLIPLLLKSPGPRVIMVSSARMLVQRLNVEDTQCEKMEPYDGAMACAQSKRQLVIMGAHLATKYPDIHFSSMHPGWVDTPGAKDAMSDCYELTRDKLRTPEQGADTIVWLAVSAEALKNVTGLFYHDRRPVPEHLPLAWSKPYKTEEDKLMDELETITERFHA